MKARLFTKTIALLLAIGLFSCEQENTTTLKKQIEIDELLSNTGSPYRKKINSFENSLDECLEDFELWYNFEGVKTFFGNVTIYKEGSELVIKSLVDESLTNWGIITTWLLVSPTKDWTGVQPEWYSDPNIMIDDTHGGSKMVILKVPLEDWMVKDCFYIAFKVLLKDGSNSVWPRAYINIDANLRFIGLDPFCLCDGPGTGTPGYWKNHANAWPVESITIGGVTYTVDEAIAIMKRNGVEGDKTYNMFEQLVAAKLNVLIGNVSGCIDDTIVDADAWMAAYGPVGSGVEASSDEWQIDGEDLKDMLDDYNNGRLCAEHRD